MSTTPPDRAPFVELRNVSKKFGGVHALTDVTLDVARGTIHGLVGENGAGKSTLGKVIAGVHQPDSGEVVIDGQPVHLRSPREALGHGVAMMAQELMLVPGRTVIDNVFMGVESSRVGVRNAAAMRRRYAALVDAAGFRLPPDALVASLRIADQQKVEILKALARNARLLIMDEPTAALGRDDAQRLFEVVRHLRQRGTTIVYVSHFLEEVLALVDVVSVLRDGQLVKAAAAAHETVDSLVTAMLGRPVDVTFPPKRPVAPTAPVVLAVEGLSRPPAFSEVTFQLRAGEILGIAGLVGSGRSEVARAIFGADRATSGRVLVEGRTVSCRHPREAVSAGIAMVPEDRKRQGLHMVRTATENVTLAHIDAVSRAGVIAVRRRRRYARALLARVAVAADVAQRRVETLSGGNQQKVLFGKWLFRRPRVLIADEPTRGVDVGAKRAIYDLLTGLADDGMGVIVISSELEEVLGLAHRVLVMRGGRLVAELDGKSATEDAVMMAAFGAVPSGDAVAGVAS